ncbi:MAG: cytochrome P450 [Xenococcaceae cyanobacterium MO_167.B27]|nr:cytochrome P450 [Xenococcaceae cyanobacterium MO_167.B27]
MGKSLPKLNQHRLKQRLTWIADPVKYMETAFKDYPDLFLAEIIGFGGRIVFVQHPVGVQQILTGERQNFIASGKVNGVLQPIVGSDSILLLNGDRHKKRRKLLLPPFHGERMQAYGKLVGDITMQAFEGLTPNQVFTGRKVSQYISLQVILEAVYGLKDSKRSQELRPLITKLSDIFRSPLTSAFLFFPWLQKDLGAWSPWGYFLRQREAIDQRIYEEIEERKATPDISRQDILSLLMSAKDELGNSLTLSELRDELMTLMFAGHETTANSMSWALYWIHQLPEVKRKLISEIASLGESPDPMAIAKLPYLNAVCQETLRIYPTAMITFPRVVQETTEVLGYELEPGQAVLGCIYLVHQREDIYPDAKQFKPERFLERQFSPYEFITFGGGSRRCIGEALAQFEMKLAIATILTNYDLALADNQPELPQRRGVTLAPARGVKMVFKGKKNK